MEENKHITDGEPEFALEDPYQFLQNSAEAIHVMTPQGVIAWANQKELDLLGYTKEEYIGHHISEFYVDRFVINDILCRLIYETEILNYPAELKCKGGSTVQVLLSANKYNDAHGELIHTRCLTRDISELKMIMSRTEESNARILNQLLVSTQLLELVASTKWQTDYQGHITHKQTNFAVYTGQSAEQQLNYGWIHAFHIADQTSIKENLLHALQNNQPYKQCARIYNKFHAEYLECGIFGILMPSFDEKACFWYFLLVDAIKIQPPPTNL